jgi:hypothetical protein
VLTASGAGTFTAPVYTATGAATLPVLVGAGVGAFSAGGFTPITNPSGAWGDDRAGAWGDEGRRGVWSDDVKGRWGT